MAKKSLNLAENPRKSKKLAGLKPQHPSLFGCTDTGETGDTGAVSFAFLPTLLYVS